MAGDPQWFESASGLARAGAEIIARAADRATRERGIFTLAIPGGRSPRGIFGLLANGNGPRLPPGAVHLFWTDERCLPPDHPDSNVRQGMELLARPAAVPAANLHPPRFLAPPERMAEAYRGEIDDFFAARGGAPVFDMVLLGMGADGHVASIFPGETAAAEASTVFATAGRSASPPVPRISLGLTPILEARRVVLLAVGREKAARLASGDRLLPAARVAAASRTTVLACRRP